MLPILYAVAYLSVLVFAVLWYYSKINEKETKLPKIGFLVTIVGYVVLLVIINGSIIHKLIFGAREFAFLAILVIVTNLLAKKKALFISFLLVLVVGISLFYFNFLKNSFIYNQTLDKNAELLFDIKNTQGLDKIKTSLNEYNLKIEKAFPNLKYNEYSELDDYYIVDIPDEYSHELSEIVEQLSATGLIDGIEQNEKVKLEPLDGDEPLSSNNKFSVNDPLIGNLWGFTQMNVNVLYDYINKNKITPKRKAKIAILDTGVDSGHEDISGNYKSTEKASDTDKHGHGTHCAGIAAAVSNNEKGIASFSPGNRFVEVTSVQVLNANGAGTQQSIIRGIIKAADNGADVLSLSLGGYSSDQKQRAYNEAIKYANKSGAIIVVAAGNENDNAKDYAPANCKGVITVSAVDSQLARASFSNYISEVEMGIAAPGVNIMSTLPGNKYDAWNGTSMATPYVAGLLGMMKAINPNITTTAAYKILKGTGKDTKDTPNTGKFIQPFEAFKAASKQ